MSVDSTNSTGGPGKTPLGPADSEQEKAMSPVLQDHIGRQVREMFDSVADEPVPEHLLRLLKDLDQSGDN